MFAPPNPVAIVGRASSTDVDGDLDDLETNSATAPVSGDYSIRDTSTHTISIPVAAAGFTGCKIGIRTSTAFDQTITFSVYVRNGTQANKNAGGGSLAMTDTIAAAVRSFTVGPGAVNSTGTSNNTNGGHYECAVMGKAPKYVVLTFVAGTNPTTGTFTLDYIRW